MTPGFLWSVLQTQQQTHEFRAPSQSGEPETGVSYWDYYLISGTLFAWASFIFEGIWFYNLRKSDSEILLVPSIQQPFECCRKEIHLQEELKEREIKGFRDINSTKTFCQSLSAEQCGWFCSAIPRIRTRWHTLPPHWAFLIHSLLHQQFSSSVCLPTRPWTQGEQRPHPFCWLQALQHAAPACYLC